METDKAKTKIKETKTFCLSKQTDFLNTIFANS